MLVYAFILFALSFVVFMFFLIKTAPYGYEDQNGMHFFKTSIELEIYIQKHSSAVAHHQTPSGGALPDSAGLIKKGAQ